MSGSDVPLGIEEDAPEETEVGVIDVTDVRMDCENKVIVEDADWNVEIGMAVVNVVVNTSPAPVTSVPPLVCDPGGDELEAGFSEPGGINVEPPDVVHQFC